MYLKYVFLLIILLLVLKSYISVENFDNCSEIQNIYNSRLEYFKNNKYGLMLGYNPNDYIYKTLMMKSDDPLPVNANYWYNKY